MVTSPFHPEVIPAVPLHHVAFMKFMEMDTDRVALVDAVSGRTLTYKQLVTLSKRLACRLYRMGVRKGDVVAMFTPNSIYYPVVMFAAMWVGAIVTTANPHYTKYELSYHIKDSTAKYIYTVASHLQTVSHVSHELGSQVKGVICDGGGEGSVSLSSLFEDDTCAEWTEVQRTPFNPREDVALLPYSSGTTGLPKGVMLTHYNIVANLIQFGHPDMQPLPEDVLEEQMVALGLIPFYHVYGLIGLLVMALCGGAKVVVMQKFKPREFLAAIEKYKIATLLLVPSLVVFLAKSDLVKEYDLSSVRSVGSGAAPLSVESENEARSRLPGAATMKQGFGMTETTVAVLTHSVRRRAKPGSVGNLVSGTEGKVIDVSTGRLLGPFERGELCVRGPQIMKGYWNKPDATSHTIDEFGFLHTGDIAYYDREGYFFIVDRIKELIKCKGLQVAPAELEAVLLTHPLVADVGVTGIPHPTSGEIPRAYVVLKEGVRVKVDDIKVFVDERVAHYKRLDGGVFFIDEIPKAPSGKILRRKLKEMALQSKI